MAQLSLLNVPRTTSKTVSVTKTTNNPTTHRKTLISPKKPTTAYNKPVFVVREDYSTDEYPIAAHIQHRRLQMLIHSRIYYCLNDNLVDDSTWANWALDLADYQNKYPEISKRVCFYESFKDWDGSTGAFLPLDDPWVIRKTNEIYSANRGK